MTAKLTAKRRAEALAELIELRDARLAGRAASKEGQEVIVELYDATRDATPEERRDLVEEMADAFGVSTGRIYQVVAPEMRSV